MLPDLPFWCALLQQAPGVAPMLTWQTAEREVLGCVFPGGCGAQHPGEGKDGAGLVSVLV